MRFIKIIILILPFLLFGKSPDWSAVQPEALKLFQEYLRINTSNPPGDVVKAVEWMANNFDAEGIEYKVLETPDPTRKHLLATFPGKNKALKPLLIMNHMDVVPADAERWAEDPFSGAIKDDYIWGRGALDMKCMGLMEIMSFILLKREGWEPERTVKLLSVADEETFGEYGARWVVENHWEDLNPEWVWDEGGIGTINSFPNTTAFVVATAQKKTLWLDLIVEGKSGHGSSPYKGHPNEVLIQALENITEWDTKLEINPIVDEAFNRLGKNIGGLQGFILKNLDKKIILMLAGGMITGASKSLNAMVRNTVSITMLNSGYKINVIPEKAEASLDIRLLPETDPEAFIEKLASIIDDDRVKIIPRAIPQNKFTSDHSTEFFSTLTDVVKKEAPEAVVTPFMTIGGTDSKYFQAKGVNTYGIIPVFITNDELDTMHGIDERISIENLMRGIRIMYQTVKTTCE